MTKIQQYVIIHNIAVYPFMIAMVIEDGASPLIPWVRLTLIFGVPLSALICVGRWEFGTIGWAARQQRRCPRDTLYPCIL